MKTLQFSKVALVLAAAFLFTFSLSSSAQVNGVFKPDPSTQGKILQGYGKLPLRFEANQGQTDARVKFLSRGAGYTLFLTSGEAVLAFRKTSAQMKDRSALKAPAPEASKSAVLHMQLVGSNPASAVSGLDEMPGKSNYFIGNDPKKWQTNVANYAKVRYRRVYPGVDLVYYGNPGQLEYDFVVAPGADPSSIRLKFRGAGRLKIDDNGDLVLGADGEQVRLQKPQVYQEASGTRRAVEGRYWIAGANTISFRVADYDRSKPLIVDPVLVYSTYLGGSGDDSGTSIAVDSSGNAYVTGYTSSIDFPTMNPLQPTYAGGSGSLDVFVAKLNSTGSALVYSTYLGGSNYDSGTSIAVDSSGNAYVTGYTYSTDFPTMNALQGTTAGSGDVFVAKLNPTGSALVYSTYLGGSGIDYGYGIAADASGNAYVTGFTCSTNFPTANAEQAASGGRLNSLPPCGDVFVTKLNATGTALVYSTYLGGSGDDAGRGIVVDSSGNAYVTGYTSSIDFPTMNPLQPANAGSNDAFVAKLNSTGSALVYSTYLGGNVDDYGYGIAVDIPGNAYVMGQTGSTNFPTMNPLQPANAGGIDVFVAKLNSTGSALVYSTYLGGNVDDYGYGIAADSSGNAYVTGLSTNFPTTNPLRAALGWDVFVAKLNPTGSALVYSTYLGGSGFDDGNGIAVDSSGNAYVAGYTYSTDFPTMNALQPSYAGGTDAFVAKIASFESDNTPPITTANPSPGPNINGWNNTNVTVYLNATDNPGGSGVKQIQFALGGAQNTGWQTVAGNAASVTISAEGTTVLSYFATDNAGNQETAKTLTVRIDKTNPTVTYSGTLSYTVDQTVNITCVAADSLSGVASTTCASITNVPAYSFTLGSHTLSATATDKAGNVGSGSTNFTVRVTFASLINLVNKFDTKRDVAAIMVGTLEVAQAAASVHAAKVADALLEAFTDEVSKQSGKSLTAAQAAILIQYATSLRM